MCLLNVSSCAILQHLSESDYREAADLLSHIILITDIANHVKKMPEMEEIAKPNVFDKNNTEHQYHLLGLLMTCSDLSQVTKPLKTALAICELIREEFHQQGDAEKLRGHTPHPMMDRSQSNLPNEQIGFIKHLALPAFETLSSIVPESMAATNTVKSLLSYWENQVKQ